MKKYLIITTYTLFSKYFQTSRYFFKKYENLKKKRCEQAWDGEKNYNFFIDFENILIAKYFFYLIGNT